MHDQPSVPEMIRAVRNFIEETAAPQLTGHAAFHARVALNAIDTVLRDLEGRTQNDTQELASLKALLGPDSNDKSLPELVGLLCTRIESGDMGLNTPGLLAHLKTTAIAQLKVDQPKYSGLTTALKGT